MTETEQRAPDSAKRPAPPAPPAPMVALREFLSVRIGEIKVALPPHISPERFIRVVLTAASITPDILACDKQTLWNSCLRACNDGLLPDGIEGAIVPFKGKAQWMPMYQGLLKKFRNSGEFKWVAAGIVYEGDEYDHFIDETGEHFRHRAADAPSGKIRRVYAIATTKGGGSFIADMPLADINKRRAMSRATRDDAPWKEWPEEMMKKTALRMLSKLLPKSSDLDALLRRDEEDLLGVPREERGQMPAPQGPLVLSALDQFAGEPGAKSPPAEGPPERAGDNQNQALQGGAGDGQPPGESETKPEPPPAPGTGAPPATPGKRSEHAK